MLVGETGVGKSTLINLMVNYIFGVKWNHDFRFELIRHEPVPSARSQTKFITSYTFYPVESSALDYTLTIIDTPGYGDTEGIDKDNELTKQIKMFFLTHGISHIDGVGFVIKASTDRLTPTQQYIFGSILDIFGKDMKDNIFLMITFCGIKRPEVLDCIVEAHVPHVGHFKFNNEALFACNTDKDDVISKEFWKIGIKSLERFLAEFEKMNAQTLKQTELVLEVREEIDSTIQVLHTQVSSLLDAIHVFQQEEIVIKRRESDVDRKEMFEYDVEVTKAIKRKLPDGKYVTVCKVCSYTCHLPCTISNNDKKYNCAAMEGNILTRNKRSCCRVCPDKCHWTKHSNERFHYERQKVVETRSLEDLVRRYCNISTGEHTCTVTAETMLNTVQQSVKDTYGEVLKLISRAQDSIQRLNEIALRKSAPMTKKAYIETLIKKEERDKSAGYEERIEKLKGMLTLAEVTDEVMKGPRIEHECNQADHHKYCKHLKTLDREQIIQLGEALGLDHSKLEGMQDLPADMVAAWLREEDDVLEKSGPPTSQSLVKALRDVDQTGIASTLELAVDFGTL